MIATQGKRSWKVRLGNGRAISFDAICKRLSVENEDKLALPVVCIWGFQCVGMVWLGETKRIGIVAISPYQVWPIEMSEMSGETCEIKMESEQPVNLVIVNDGETPKKDVET
jgi:hypothetical protein